MLTLLVFIHVKDEFVEAFIAATKENAKNSIHEAGIERFDLNQQEDDPTRFILYEVYKSKEDNNKHKETLHYKKWFTAVEDMLIEPRSRIYYETTFSPQKA